LTTYNTGTTLTTVSKYELYM